MAKLASERGEYVVLTLRAFEDDGQFVSDCVELQTASRGDTLDEAIANARDATQLYLEAITELRERDRVFRERGVEVITRAPSEIRLSANVQPGDVVQGLVLPLPHLAPAHA